MTETSHSPDHAEHLRDFMEQAEAQRLLMTNLLQQHGGQLADSLTAQWTKTATDLQAGLKLGTPQAIAEAWTAYLKDSQQRTVLFLDTLRQRGDAAAAREADGLKPVLVFDYELVVDGAELDRPVNYSLVRILPPEDCPPTRPDGRPWVIIDPRAGHGSGIGGFKAESEVGVALDDGHPVYFVIFHPDPEPTQTLADVTAAEAIFLKTITERHPNAPKPLVTGNCQGGWAAMILAATHPDLTGPLVIAGAPLSYWAGRVGKNPFRYYGGLAGGAVPALLASDLGAGRFDGASLVQNFEGLNPAKTMWRKNYDLYAGVDDGTERFLEFEKWWSGYYLMNEAEIRWIVENLFVGNKLTAGKAVLDDGTPVDLTRISAPIVVFASHGDNITPPQQALHWICDLYETTAELKARGHVIVYTLHDSIGHLGIFVSAKVANAQHKQITSVVKTIESLAPGLYEMIIHQDADGTYEVEFRGREVDDIRDMNDGPAIAEEFAAVSELSEWAVKSYEILLRPWLQRTITPDMAEAARKSHPMRAQIAAFGSENPMMRLIEAEADKIRAARMPAASDNPFVQAEHVWADMVERNLDLYRDARDAMIELTFHGIYANPFLRAIAPGKAEEPSRHEIEKFPQVREVLSHIDIGGYPEAIVRMMVLLARARGAVRSERLERANALLHRQPPFDTMSDMQRAQMIHEQSMIVDLAGRDALATLPRLLRDDVDRIRALNLVFDVAGPMEEMDAATVAMFEQFQMALLTRVPGWHKGAAVDGGTKAAE